MKIVETLFLFGARHPCYTCFAQIEILRTSLKFKISKLTNLIWKVCKTLWIFANHESFRPLIVSALTDSVIVRFSLFLSAIYVSFYRILRLFCSNRAQMPFTGVKSFRVRLARRSDFCRTYCDIISHVIGYLNIKRASKRSFHSP